MLCFHMLHLILQCKANVKQWNRTKEKKKRDVFMRGTSRALRKCNYYRKYRHEIVLKLKLNECTRTSDYIGGIITISSLQNRRLSIKFIVVCNRSNVVTAMLLERILPGLLYPLRDRLPIHFKIILIMFLISLNTTVDFLFSFWSEKCM